MECLDRWLSIVMIVLRETLIFSLRNQTKKQIILHGSELVNKDLTPFCVRGYTELNGTLNRRTEQKKTIF